MADDAVDRNRRKVTAFLTAIVVTLLAIAIVFVFRDGPILLDVLQVLQGPAVAAYGAVFVMCMHRGRVAPPLFVFIGIGATHPVWVTLGVFGLEHMLMPFGLANEEILSASLFALTGIGLTIPVLWSVRRWWPVAPMMVATVVSCSLIASGLWHKFGLNAFTLGAMPLHAGVAWTMFIAAMRSNRPAQAGQCSACDYDLSGLRRSASRCPECGTAIPPQTPPAAP